MCCHHFRAQLLHDAEAQVVLACTESADWRVTIVRQEAQCRQHATARRVRGSEGTPVRPTLRHPSRAKASRRCRRASRPVRQPLRHVPAGLPASARQGARQQGRAWGEAAAAAAAAEGSPVLLRRLPCTLPPGARTCGAQVVAIWVGKPQLVQQVVHRHYLWKQRGGWRQGRALWKFSPAASQPKGLHATADGRIGWPTPLQGYSSRPDERSSWHAPCAGTHATVSATRCKVIVMLL